MKQWFRWVLGVIVVLSIALAWTWNWSACAFAKTPSEKYGCYVSRVNHIVTEDGVAAGLAYVRYAIYPSNGYAMVHVVLHEVGESAYESGASIDDAKQYLSPYTALMERNHLMGGFDGFLHGYLSSYFVEDRRPLPERIATLCGGGVSIPGITDDTFRCYHAVGHALMHAEFNVLAQVIVDCNTLTLPAALKGCLYGAFMEDSFLYDPQYHHEASRPDVRGTSLRGICETYTGVEASSCDSFVGESYMTGGGDLAGAFAECAQVGGDGEKLCIARLGAVAAATSISDHADVVALCRQNATEAQQILCQSSIRTGISGALGIPVQESLRERVVGVALVIRYSFGAQLIHW